MKLADKILNIRKTYGMSQDDLAEKLNVSRQAISRWEMGTAQPDTPNVLQLSKLFGVTTDYLLNDDYESDRDVPVVKETEITTKAEASRQSAFILLTGLNVMILFHQLIACFVLQNAIFSLAGTMLSIAAVVGFEFGYRYRKIAPEPESAKKYYYKFYVIAFWLAAYFPIRLLANVAMMLYPRSYSGLVFEIIVVLVYLLVSILATQLIKKKAK
ncbi:helix-turn-helix domain-containing protein [Ruminiclostridium cellobioparum]|uniref:Xre family transcriptional regulator n=1 Tax=Ruminiclostridium cellobioparum subsp. termitidis CT1112 TaxID=1195236 RepID=S0FMR5_RUMCE|nr:helix-turn-helix transcriptional regulator [Ruminiclostridium cellobioparum]EMS73520.1 Xre family transcriptional regulator [Ruminiclostridium cellobioparum subsp. termitidis CT1112]